MFEHELLITLRAARLAVADGDKCAGGGQARREAARDLRAQWRIATLDADQDQARGEPVLQLPDHQALRG